MDCKDVESGGYNGCAEAGMAGLSSTSVLRLTATVRKGGVLVLKT